MRHTAGSNPSGTKIQSLLVFCFRCAQKRQCDTTYKTTQTTNDRGKIEGGESGPARALVAAIRARRIRKCFVDRLGTASGAAAAGDGDADDAAVDDATLARGECAPPPPNTLASSGGSVLPAVSVSICAQLIRRFQIIMQVSIVSTFILLGRSMPSLMTFAVLKNALCTKQTKRARVKNEQRNCATSAEATYAHSFGTLCVTNFESARPTNSSTQSATSAFSLAYSKKRQRNTDCETSAACWKAG
jgi:hypothetical protein